MLLIVTQLQHKAGSSYCIHRTNFSIGWLQAFWWLCWSDLCWWGSRSPDQANFGGNYLCQNQLHWSQNNHCLEWMCLCRTGTKVIKKLRVSLLIVLHCLSRLLSMNLNSHLLDYSDYTSCRNACKRALILLFWKQVCQWLIKKGCFLEAVDDMQQASPEQQFPGV